MQLMQHDFFQRNLLCLAIASILPVSQAYSQDDFSFDDETSITTPDYQNYVELGIGHTSDGNGKFGEYSNDLDDSGNFSVGSVHLSKGSEDGSRQLSFTGSKDLYGDNYELEYWSPGDLKIKLSGSNSQKVEFGNLRTLYPSGNSNSLSLPAGFTNSADPDLYGFRDLTVERNNYAIAVTKIVDANWSLNFDYQRQSKDGEKSSVGSQGFAGTGIVVESLDYQHDQFTLGVDYVRDKLALGASYYFSDFDNGDQRMTFENPNAGAIGTEELALAPDNTFSRFDLYGGYQLAARTQLSWLLNWSQAKQNEDFLPYALDLDYYSSNPGTPPQGSLHGEVNRFNGRITLVSRPTNHFNYKLEYAIRDRESDHDPLLLNDLHYNGSVTAQAAPSHVYDKETETFKAEGGYRFADRSKLRFGWEQENIDRTRDEIEYITATYERISSTDRTQEDTLWATYKFAPLGPVNLNLRVEHANRDGDISNARKDHLHYKSWDPDLGIFVSQGENTLPFFLVDRDIDTFSLNGDWMISSTLVLSADISRINEDYNSDYDGVLGRDNDSENLMLSWTPSQNLSLSVYSLWQSFSWKQDGTTSNGSSVVTNLWTSDGEDDTVSVGLTMNWQVIPDKLKVAADISNSETDSKLSSYDSIEDASDKLPNYGSEVTRMNLTAEWQLNPQTAIKARYVYEDWTVDDYAWADGGLLSGIAAGWTPSNEDGQAIIVSVKCTF